MDEHFDDDVAAEQGDVDEVSGGTGDATRRRPLTVALNALVAVGLLAIAGTAGWIVGNNSQPSIPSIKADSVDAGFARDMAAHHTQATEMAGYTRDHTSDPSIKLLAFDIETAQYAEIGQMQGWLDGWGLTRESTIPQMAWMNHSLGPDELMPGMATEAQVDKLETLTGKALDIDFLQLMIYHHQGGLPMEQYAEEHAQTPYVRNLAQKMFQNQSNEIIQMEQLLRERGASPLSPPSE